MRQSFALSALAVSLLGVTAGAQSSAYTTELVVNGLARPVAVLAAPGVSDRLFVVEQNQADIHIIDLNTNSILPTPFLDLTGLVQTSGNEQGLLGLAFHPDYATNGYFYVNYTSTASGATRVERYTRSANPDLANAASAFLILQISQPQSNHNAGDLDFGPDGMLWIATGDGGGANDSGTGHAAGGNAQSGSTLLGKMLRLDVDGGSPYAIPSDNPYVGDPAVLDEIWALGLRNPFRVSFDSENDDLWIGDVGQDAREELNYVSAADIAAVAAGSHAPFNFGWRCQEGLLCTGLTGCTCNGPTLTLPATQYAHGQGVSIIDGATYRGDAVPDLAGTHFFADHYSNIIRALRVENGVLLSGPTDVATQLDPPGALTITSVAGMGEGPDGELYIADMNGGEIFKLVPAGPYLGLGSGLAGLNGKPIHFGSGGVGVGQPGGLHLRDANANAIAAVFLSFTEGVLPFKGGTLLAWPFFASLTLNTNGVGAVDITWTNLGSVPSGATLVTQFGVQDPGAPVGVALSNALLTTWP